MIQLYLASVVLNFLGGLSLLTRRTEQEGRQALLHTPTARITIGVLALLAGAVKLVVRAPLEDVAVFGDILPAIAGIAVGVVLVGDVYANRRSIREAGKATANAGWRFPIAVAAIAAAVLHFLFPATVIF